MSLKEPAIRLLHERYSESFAITIGTGGRIHLFLIKLGLWSLVWTFTPRDFGGETQKATIYDALKLIEDALSDRNHELLSSLNGAVSEAQLRIKAKVEKYYPRSNGVDLD